MKFAHASINKYHVKIDGCVYVLFFFNLERTLKPSSPVVLLVKVGNTLESLSHIIENSNS